MATVQIGFLMVFAALLVAAAWHDLRSLHIADAFPLAIVATYLAWALCGWVDGRYSPLEAGLAVACAVGLFAVGALAFAVGAWGGGDVKLLAAASLFAGPTGLILDYLLVTALAGGLLAVMALAGLSFGPPRVEPHAASRARLPYGPAIAAGGLWIAAVRALA